MYQLIGEVIDEAYNARCSKITLDFERVRFVEPTGVTVVSNLIEFLKKSKARVLFRKFDHDNEAIRYLDDSGFFERYLKKKVFAGSTLRRTTLPLELVEHARSHAFVDNRLTPWLADVVGVDPRAFGVIKVCLHEIYNNIQDHSSETIGCTFAQHYPSPRQVQIAISDFGVGIPQNVRKVERDITDHDAIALACKEGFTTHSTKRNRGAGLDVLTNYIVNRNAGVVIIDSHEGYVVCSQKDGLMRRVPRRAQGRYPGTLVQITLQTDRFADFVADAEEEDFTW